MRLDRNSNYINRNTNYNPQFKMLLPVYVANSKNYKTTEKVMEHFQEIISHNWKQGSTLSNLKNNFIKHLKNVEDPSSVQMQTRIIKNIDSKETKPSLGYFATDDTAITLKLGDETTEGKILNNPVNRAKFMSKNPQLQTPYMGMYISFDETSRGINITDISFVPIPEDKFKTGTCFIA